MFTLLTSREEKGLKVASKFRDIYDDVHNRYFMLENLTNALGENIHSVEDTFFRYRTYLQSDQYAHLIESLAGIIDAYLKALGEKKNPRSFVNTLEDFLKSRMIRLLTDCYPFMDYRGSKLKNYLQRIAQNLPDGEGFVRLFNDAWRALSSFHMSEMQNRIYGWLDVYVLVQQIYNALKKTAHVIDYADIELIARDFLIQLTDYGFFRSRLETGIRYILIDEFQDTSELQWSALLPLAQNCIRNGGTLFYVGDVKQSIYRWRGGEPYLFNRVREELGIDEQRLPYSYRQNRVLLDFVNRVFAAFCEKTEGGFVYTEQGLPPHITDRERGYVSLQGVEGEEELAALVLEQLKNLHGSGIVFDDIAILCRTNREVGVIESLLRDQGVAFNSAGRTRLLDDFYIRDLVNTIGFVLNPGEPLYLAGLLRTPFFRCGYDTLEELTAGGSGEALTTLKTLDPGLWERVQMLLRISRYTTPSGFILDLYRELDVFAHYPDKHDATMAFLELAYGFERGRENCRIRDFYRYLGDNFDRIMLSAGDHRGVSVQTIHSAKGLEYHTVIIPFLKQRFHARLDGSFMYNRDGKGHIHRLAIARKVYMQYYADQAEISRLQYENNRDYQIDEINTLYVALTRARENLVILPQLNVKSDTVGTELMGIVCPDKGTQLCMGELVSSEGESAVPVKEYTKTYPVQESIESEEIAAKDVEEEAYTTRREKRRKGLLRGLLFHAVMEGIKRLPIQERDLDRLLEAASVRESRGYAKQELAAAREEVKPMILNVIADPGLAKYFSDNALSELSIVSDRYQNLVGRIDRVYMGEHIEVIDFKTNPVQDDDELKRFAGIYGKQVDTYCSVLEEIYPDRNVRGYLYFAEAAESKRLVEVERKK